MQRFIDSNINIHFTDHGGILLNYPQCSNASQNLQTSAKQCIKVVKIIFKFYMKLSGSTNSELKWELLDFLFSFTTKLAQFHVRNMIVLYDYENIQWFSLQHLHKLCQMCSLFIILQIENLKKVCPPFCTDQSDLNAPDIIIININVYIN